MGAPSRAAAASSTRRGPSTSSRARRSPATRPRAQTVPYEGGGGIYNDGDIVTIVNSTIAGNSTNNDGGGINNFGDIGHIQSTTIAGNTANTGGGLYHATSNNVTFDHRRADQHDHRGQYRERNRQGLRGGSGRSPRRPTTWCRTPTATAWSTATTGTSSASIPSSGRWPTTAARPRRWRWSNGSPAIDAGTTTDAPSTDQRGLPRPAPATAGSISAPSRSSRSSYTPPVASNLSVSTNEDALLSGQVSATDTNNAPLTYSVVAAPIAGDRRAPCRRVVLVHPPRVLLRDRQLHLPGLRRPGLQQRRHGLDHDQPGDPAPGGQHPVHDVGRRHGRGPQPGQTPRTGPERLPC